MKYLSKPLGCILVIVAAALLLSSRANVKALVSPASAKQPQASADNRTAPAMLVSPKNGQLTDDPHQLFAWQPQEPPRRGKVTYQLRVAEVFDQQTPEAAVQFNAAYLLKDDLEQTTYERSASDAPFVDGRKYAWQVKAYFDGNLLKESEVRLFSYAQTQNSDKIQPPPPVSCASCVGGMFESGNLNSEPGWAGLTGLWQGMNTIMTPTGFVSNRHTVTTCPSLDPVLVNHGINLPTVYEGLHAVRLGNSAAGAEAEQLRHTFVPTTAKPNFGFSYAVVLQDPSHDAADQPFFNYRAYIGASWGAGLQIMEFKKAANHNDPYFQNVNTSLVYRNWDCETINLSAYIGQSVTIEFETADCRLGGHYGYAYIDGFCEDKVTAALTLPDNVCINDPIIADGSASTGETDFFLSVEPSDQWWGRYPALEVGHWYNAQQAGQIDLKNFYQTYGSTGNNQFKCDAYYRITLAVKNHCVGWKSVVKLLYIPPCDATVVDLNVPAEACINNNLPIWADGTASANETAYFVSIEPSDQWWGRNPTKEVMQWFPGQAGQIDLRAFYLAYGSSGNDQFQYNTYYRITLAVKNQCDPWRSVVKLLYIKPRADCLSKP